MNNENTYEGTTLKKLEAKRIIFASLEPKYQRACKSAIEFCIKNRDLIYDKRKRLTELDRDSEEFKEIYKFLYGHFDKQSKKQVKGFIAKLNSDDYDLITKNMFSGKKMVTDAFIESSYNKIYKEKLKCIVEDIYKEIKEYKPSSIEVGSSEHDFNFILTIKKEKKSFTINTVLAGGDIQCLHLRVLRRLHNSIVF